MTEPVQDFHLGQRVQPKGELPFEVLFICLRGGRVEYSGAGRSWYSASLLTLVPERPPYAPSERRIVLQDGGLPTFAFTEVVSAPYRCETDTELAMRHAVERNAYYAQGDAP